MKLRTQVLLFFLLFALAPLLTAVALNLPLVLGRMELFYHKAHLQNLRADFRDLDQHLASREEMVKLLAKLPEPGTVLGGSTQEEEAIDKARTRYTQWINQILWDQLDIIQIVFLDQNGHARFWLDRERETQRWNPTTTPPEAINPQFIQAALKSTPGSVLVSPISLKQSAAANDPRTLMTLRLISTIGSPEEKSIIGAVTINIDVGGIARYYRNTLWVHADGDFLEQVGSDLPSGSAFSRFPGLQEIFKQEKPALWKGQGSQIMWVPMFLTEQSGPLWVGRSVDPSPISEFRNALTIRVLTVVFVLSVAVWFVARRVAARADQISHELIDGVEQVLEDKDHIAFNWDGPRELQKLGESLSLLATQHGKNIHNLRLHAEKLEESNRYKSQFLANVSHELRTPLNSILLLSKLLAESKTGLTSEQIQQARVIHEAGSDLQALIDNILDLSRIEARRATINLEQVNLPALLESLVELVEPQFKEKSLPLLLEIDRAAPWLIDTDSDKVRQILKNFLSNALKFTREGSVVLRLESADGETRSGYAVCISVADSGIGIPESKHTHIFEAFKQADGSTSRRYGGTGLGLTISQQLSHLLGGEIRLQSEEGRGSTFSLLLPLSIEVQHSEEIPVEVWDNREQAGEIIRKHVEPPRVESDSGIAGKRVLLVDDDIRDLLNLTPTLEAWGLEVTAAGDGIEALEVLQEDDEFALVLMDIMMPKLDGYDTIRKIRQQGQFRDLAIIALTAKVDTADRAACLEAGANDFVAKPVDTEVLKTIIEQHLT
ncbi:MAG: response regulator [Gammaproteobacteria bacterium]|nr:response regulator [Gammaproteobacteria bacterium]MCB1872622.1 response regulator [Gammaproteobacteria bacterium]MCB1903939.1 response regulator [Gammaproteobacteria bacterium]